MRTADASAVMPFDFSRLIFASALGWLMFGEHPDAWTWLGGAIIVAATVYIAQREARLAARDAPSCRRRLRRRPGYVLPVSRDARARCRWGGLMLAPRVCSASISTAASSVKPMPARMSGIMSAGMTK